MPQIVMGLFVVAAILAVYGLPAYWGWQWGKLQTGNPLGAAGVAVVCAASPPIFWAVAILMWGVRWTTGNNYSPLHHARENLAVFASPEDAV